MNRLKHILPILLTVLLAASCDKESLPGKPESGGPENGGRREVTFSVGIEQTEPAQIAGGKRMAIRAPGADTDDRPMRCFMQVLDNSGTPYSNILEAAGSDDYTFTVSLTPGERYIYLFYADNSTLEVDDLTYVAYQAGTIAFAARLDGTPEEVNPNAVLKHIVTKLTLRHNGKNPFTTTTGDVLTATVPCAATYDVAQGRVLTAGTSSLPYAFTSDLTADSPTDIWSFYTLVPAEGGNQSITLGFRNQKMELTDLSLTADSHIILSGDLSENNGKWTINTEYYKQVFTDAFFKDGVPFGEKIEVGGSNIYDYWASDTDNRRIIEEILRTTVSEEPQDVTTPWEKEIRIHYLSNNVLYITNVGQIDGKRIEFRIFSNPHAADSNPNVNLPDKIY